MLVKEEEKKININQTNTPHKQTNNWCIIVQGRRIVRLPCTIMQQTYYRFGELDRRTKTGDDMEDGFGVFSATHTYMNCDFIMRPLMLQLTE